MQTKWMHPLFLPAFLLLLAGTAAAQTSLGASLYGAFGGASSANGVEESPTNTAGGLFELRHISNPILGFEATYSYNRADETYTANTAVPAGSCTTAPCVSSVTIPAAAHEITADWVPSLHVANLRPFGVLGAGVLLNMPSNGRNNSQSSTQAVYVYGAGLDWGLLPHLGLRLQYRGNLYKAPDVTTLYTSIDAFRHTAEPMIGIYLNL